MLSYPEACHCTQAEEGGGACTNIGSLFDESVTEAADSARFQDFGAADEALLTGIVLTHCFLPSLDDVLCHDVVVFPDCLLQGCADWLVALCHRFML